jgi:hypothetical protein
MVRITEAMVWRIGDRVKKFYGEMGIDEFIRNGFFPDYSYRGVYEKLVRQAQNFFP